MDDDDDLELEDEIGRMSIRQVISEWGDDPDVLICRCRGGMEALLMEVLKNKDLKPLGILSFLSASLMGVVMESVEYEHGENQDEVS